MHKRLMFVFLFVGLLSLSMVSAGFGSKLYSFFSDVQDVRFSPAIGPTCWSSGSDSLSLLTYPDKMIDVPLSGDFELTGLYRGVGGTSGGWATNYEDLFIYLTLADGSKGYRFRTAPSDTDTPHTALTVQPLTLPAQWSCWKGNGDKNCEETMNRTLYLSNQDVPFRLSRVGNTITWDVNGQSQMVVLASSFVGVPLKLNLAGWNDRSKNIVTNVVLTSASCTSTPQATCTDSDNGLNYNLASNVVASKGVGFDGLIHDYAPPATLSDACFLTMNAPVQSSDKVMERFCSGDIANFTIYDCPNGCADGACLSSPIVCAADVQNCGEGVTRGRNASNGCQFDACPSSSISSQTISHYGDYTVHTGDIINFGNAHKKVLILQSPTCADAPLCTTLVNRKVIQFHDISRLSYHELEEGQSLTLARNGEPLTSSFFSDVRASIIAISIVLDGNQSNTLSNNNQATIVLSKPQVCQGLIDDLVHPDETFVGNDGTEYRLSSNETYVYDDLTQYYATWYGDAWDDGGAYHYAYFALSARVYHNSSYDATDYHDSAYCSVKDISGNRVYVCSYRDPTYVDDEAHEREIEYVYVYWTNKNVQITAVIGSGGSLTPAEIDAKVRDVMLAFTAHLQNNNFVYSEGGERIFFDHSSLLYGAVQACPSTVTADIQYGSLACKLEPVVCPPHGYQTKICTRDGVQVSSSTLSCSPGICAGCMVPRWLGASTGDNVCLPYGTRLLTADVDRETIQYSDMQEADEFSVVLNTDYSGTITLNEDLSDQVRYLSVNGEKIALTKGTTFTFTEGQEYRIEVADMYENSKPYTYVVTPEDIVKKDPVENSYIVLRFSQGDQPMYCNYNGQLNLQKVRDYNGDWATCQNNYECESNVCSSGECIEVQALLDQGKGLKGFAIRLLCRLTNIFSTDGYNQCVAEAYGQ